MARGTEVIDQELESLVGLFRLLADKTRVNILMILAKGERNVTSLCHDLRLPQPTVSHHLGLLRMQNLISNRRHGKQVFYCLNGHVNAPDGDGLEITVEKFCVRVCARIR